MRSRIADTTRRPDTKVSHPVTLRRRLSLPQCGSTGTPPNGPARTNRRPAASPLTGLPSAIAVPTLTARYPASYKRPVNSAYACKSAKWAAPRRPSARPTVCRHRIRQSRHGRETRPDRLNGPLSPRRCRFDLTGPRAVTRAAVTGQPEKDARQQTAPPTARSDARS